MFPQADKDLCSALAAAWEGRGLESPTVGLLKVGDGYIKVCTVFCIVLFKGCMQILSVFSVIATAWPG